MEDADEGRRPQGADDTFASLGLAPELCEACSSLGFKKPTEIQARAVPLALAGRDLIGLAQTGSGKTAAFALPILHKLLTVSAETRKPPPSPFALVIAPTRELAFQIAEQFTALGVGIGLRAVSLVGGIDMVTQAVALAKRPHVIVATPGRLVDHLEHTKGFSLRTVSFLVLDEADRLLNMDFEKELDTVISVLPRENRRSFLFSATMTTKVAKLQRASLVNPAKVEVSDKYSTVDTLQQQYLFIPALYKDCYLVYLCNEFAGNAAIIFVDTQNAAHRITCILKHLGFPAIPIHGGMSQPKRLGALTNFKAGESQILVATDVASRGLDIPSVDIVINYDIPSHGKDYIHRVGRTARAGRAGRAFNLVTQYDVELYQKVELLIGKKLESYPSDEKVVLMFLERVSEAQRLAASDLRAHESSRRRGGRKQDGEPTRGHNSSRIKKKRR